MGLFEQKSAISPEFYLNMANGKWETICHFWQMAMAFI
jgi:hypothetical protein